MKIQNKVAIVTGGGGAIGQAICSKLAEEGAKVAVFDLYQESAEVTSEKLNKVGTSNLVCAVDVSDYKQVVAAVKKVHDYFGRIDILVNCAGGSARDKMTEFYKQDIEVIHSLLNINLFGALHCIRAVTPYMVEAKCGSILNVASIVARGGLKGCVEYGAAKGGIIAATKSLAIELGEFNINVNCISPGQVPRGKLEDEKAFANRHSVLNRICTQEDIARAVLFLVQPESDFITGQDLAVDGGRSLGLRGSY